MPQSISGSALQIQARLAVVGIEAAPFQLEPAGVILTRRAPRHASRLPLRDGKNPAAALASAGISAAPLLTASAPPAINISKDALAAELKATLMAMDNQAAQNPAGSPRAGISGTVSIDASLKARAAPEDNVFIFARNADSAQAGMPLAVLRHRVADLPLRFDLSDNNAMSPEARLSTAAKVIVTARISKSGDARPQPGDLEGASPPIPLGTEKLGIVISRAR